MTCTTTVGDVERMLFDAFPRTDAEEWDNPGLAVGDRRAAAGKIAVSLDMTCKAVLAAKEAGCSTLVTHHPAYIKSGPSEFGPAAQEQTPGPGRMAYEAARQGVAAIAMHTNADRSPKVRERFAQLLGLAYESSFEQIDDATRHIEDPGLGAVMTCDDGMNLESLAIRCRRVFGGVPRVWGNKERALSKIAFLNGSWGEPAIYDTCIAAHIDCIVVGETRYHMCLDSQPYLSIIELGHDISEAPIVDVLVDVLTAGGIPKDRIVDIRKAACNWWCPEPEA